MVKKLYIEAFIKWILPLITMVVLFFLTGCEYNRAPEEVNVSHVNYYNQNGSWEYAVYVIDGCEYLKWGHGGAHKGNCTNSVHVYRMENK